MLIAAFAVPVSASQTAEQGTSLDITKTKIAGEKASYYFAIPSYWVGKVNVERAKLPAKSLHIEQLNFFYCGGPFAGKPLPMMKLYVYNRADWKDDFPQRLVMKAKNYYFAADIIAVDKKVFTSEYDRLAFEKCFAEINTPFRVKSLLEMPSGQEELYENTVFVNGDELETKTLAIGSLCLVPLRETAEALGFKVDWIQKESAVQLSDGKTRDKFRISGNMETDERGFRVRLVDGRTYVSTAYFFKVLGKSIDTDRMNNVYISN